jgi:hypothetical protein
MSCDTATPVPCAAGEENYDSCATAVKSAILTAQAGKPRIKRQRLGAALLQCACAEHAPERP